MVKPTIFDLAIRRSSTSSPQILDQYMVKGMAFDDKYTRKSALLGEGVTSKVWTCIERNQISGSISYPDTLVAKELFVDGMITTAEQAYAELEILAILSSSKQVYRTRVVQLKEFFESRDDNGNLNSLMIVMDHAKGGELLSAINERGSLAEEDAAAIFKSVLEACAAMHEIGIAHRDIKAENVILKEPNRFDCGAQVIDFGLAARTASVISLSVATGNESSDPGFTASCGTPLYVAPEVLRVAVQEATGVAVTPYSCECDIWSCGILLHLMLTGFFPCSITGDYGTTPLLDLVCTKTSAIAFEDPAWHMISSDAKDLVERCLVGDASKRITASEALAHPWLSRYY